jgi:hypothetical protein
MAPSSPYARSQQAGGQQQGVNDKPADKPGYAACAFGLRHSLFALGAGFR